MTSVAFLFTYFCISLRGFHLALKGVYGQTSYLGTWHDVLLQERVALEFKMAGVFLWEMVLDGVTGVRWLDRLYLIAVFRCHKSWRFSGWDVYRSEHNRTFDGHELQYTPP